MNTRKLRLFLITSCLLLVAITFIVGCRDSNTVTTGEFTPEIQPLPAQLTTYEPMTIPADNPMSP